MKKLCIGLLVFFLGSTLFPLNNFKIGAYAGYFSTRDNTIKEIYTPGDITYGAKIGVRVWRGLHLWLSGTHFREVSETTLLGDITTLELTPVTLSLRYTFQLGTINPYVGGGYTYTHYKEKSDIGSTTGEGKGYSMDTGIEIKMSRRFHVDIGITYSDVKVRPTRDEVQLGGLQAGIALLVVF
ncbi:MAG: porin family protein [bacterium]|nr:porin family protein [bacterium]